MRTAEQASGFRPHYVARLYDFFLICVRIA